MSIPLTKLSQLGLVGRVGQSGQTSSEGVYNRESRSKGMIPEATMHHVIRSIGPACAGLYKF